MMHHRIRKIRNTRRSRRLLWLSRFRSDERGVQLLEVAIVIPTFHNPPSEREPADWYRGRIRARIRPYH